MLGAKSSQGDGKNGGGLSVEAAAVAKASRIRAKLEAGAVPADDQMTEYERRTPFIKPSGVASRNDGAAAICS